MGGEGKREERWGHAAAGERPAGERRQEMGLSAPRNFIHRRPPTNLACTFRGDRGVESRWLGMVIYTPRHPPLRPGDNPLD
eukprot:6192434-Pyramimonas_sp.AAC.1